MKQEHSESDLEADISNFRELLRLKPDDPSAHFNLGDALFRTGEREAALVEFSEVTRLKPEDSDAHFRLGMLLLMKGELDAAITEFREVLRLKSHEPEVRYRLARALECKGDWDAAIGEYKEAIRLEPDEPVRHYRLGLAILRKGLGLKPVHGTDGVALSDDRVEDFVVESDRFKDILRHDVHRPPDFLSEAVDEFEEARCFGDNFSAARLKEIYDKANDLTVDISADLCLEEGGDPDADYRREIKCNWPRFAEIPQQLAAIKHVRRVIAPFLSGPFAEYIRLFGQAHGLKGICVLNAHGGVNFGGTEWTYYAVELLAIPTGVYLLDDRMNTGPIQLSTPYRISNWIDRRDGKHACLIVCSCNQGALTVRSKHSLLVQADRFIPSLEAGECSWTIWNPEIGEDIDDYTIDFEWARLRKGG